MWVKTSTKCYNVFKIKYSVTLVLHPSIAERLSNDTVNQIITEYAMNKVNEHQSNQVSKHTTFIWRMKTFEEVIETKAEYFPVCGVKTSSEYNENKLMTIFV